MGVKISCDNNLKSLITKWLKEVYATDAVDVELISLTDGNTTYTGADIDLDKLRVSFVINDRGAD